MATTIARIDRLAESIAPVLQFFDGPIWSRRDEPGLANFAVGNPQEMPEADGVIACGFVALHLLRLEVQPLGKVGLGLHGS